MTVQTASAPAAKTAAPEYLLAWLPQGAYLRNEDQAVVHASKVVNVTDKLDDLSSLIDLNEKHTKGVQNLKRLVERGNARAVFLVTDHDTIVRVRNTDPTGFTTLVVMDGIPFDAPLITTVGFTRGRL